MQYQKAPQQAQDGQYESGSTVNGVSTPLTGHRAQQMSGKYRDIFLASAIIITPMVIFPAILVYLVFRYRVTEPYFHSESLRIPGLQIDPGFFLVDFSATRLAFIASWSSTVAFSLTSSVMILYSFPVALRIMKRSAKSDFHDLPTPYQLAMLVELLNGGFAGLWRWILYAFGWRSKRSKVVPVVRWSVVMLSGAVLLSLLISLADTWLHISTKTVQYLQVQTNTPSQNSFGRGFSDNCLDWSQIAASGPCILEPDLAIQTEIEGYKTVSNVSSHNTLKTVSSGSTYVLLTEPNPPPDVDFRAFTLAVTTTCMPITMECGLQPMQKFNVTSPLSFNCTNIHFQGNLMVNPWIINFPDPVKWYPNSSAGFNPVNWALASRMDWFHSFTSKDLDVLPESDGVGKFATVLGCNSTVFDVVYSQVNGTISILDSVLSSTAMGRLFFTKPPSDTQLEESMFLPVILSDNVQGIADKFALRFSQLLLGSKAGYMSPRRNLEDQTRNILLVARVPKAALYTLVLLCLAYAALGIALAVMALWTAQAGVKDVQARLNVAGLAAEAFETHQLGRPASTVEQFFEEREGNGTGRVGIGKSEFRGWRFNMSTQLQ